jgi:23S rRNA (cytidine1920-2'-O)/16S rRNA (cytidine1409-2'-O)-methyltransferase
VPRQAPLVPLLALLKLRFPDLVDPVGLVTDGAVLVDGVPAASTRTRVRADATIRLRRPPQLRGTVKLSAALAGFGVDAVGAVVLDLGAAAGGFTQALLAAGAARVYAVDAGVGQLRGWLRADPRVISLEHTNLAELGPDLIGEPVDLITLDFSYLSVADAIGQLDWQLVAPGAQLVALVKPTFELHSASLADHPDQIVAAVGIAACALMRHGWRVCGQMPSPIAGARGAIEAFVHAARR